MLVILALHALGCPALVFTELAAALGLALLVGGPTAVLARALRVVALRLVPAAQRLIDCRRVRSLAKPLDRDGHSTPGSRFLAFQGHGGPGYRLIAFLAGMHCGAQHWRCASIESKWLRLMTMRVMVVMSETTMIIKIAWCIVGTELGPQRAALETQYENGTITSAHV